MLIKTKHTQMKESVSSVVVCIVKTTSLVFILLSCVPHFKSARVSEKYD